LGLYLLFLHDALPILRRNMVRFSQRIIDEQSRHQQIRNRLLSVMGRDTAGQARTHPSQEIDYVKLRKMLTEKYEAAVQEMNEKRSEEHTSELQSREKL